MLKLILDSIEDLPEQVQEHYKKRDDGRFELETEGVDGLAVEDVSGLKRALSDIRGKHETLKKEVDAIPENIRQDPKKAVNAIKKVEEMADWDPDQEVKERIEQREKQLVEKHQEELQKITGDRDNVYSQLEGKLVDAAATQALSAAGAGKRIKLLMPHVRSQVKMVRTDSGDFVAQVVDGSGNPRVGDSHGNPMTIPQLVEEMKSSEDFSAAFDGTGATGSGGAGGDKTPSSPRGSKTVSRNDPDAMSASLEDIASGEVTVTE